jgi:hypothetical protein
VRSFSPATRSVKGSVATRLILLDERNRERKETAFLQWQNHVSQREPQMDLKLMGFWETRVRCHGRMSGVTINLYVTCV